MWIPEEADNLARIKANLTIKCKENLIMLDTDGWRIGVSTRNVVGDKIEWLWICTYEGRHIADTFATESEAREYIDKHFDRWLDEERPKLLLALL